MNFSDYKIISRLFYDRKSDVVAQDSVGKYIIRKIGEQALVD